jgi:hypothetical protein
MSRSTPTRFSTCEISLIMEKLRLIWKGKLLGVVELSGTDQPWFHGKFVPIDLDPLLVDFFNFIVNEEYANKEPPFPEELLADDYWFLESESGKIIPISLPAVYLSEGNIIWRRR